MPHIRHTKIALVSITVLLALNLLMPVEGHPSTATFVDSFDVSGQETNLRGIAFSTDGTKMFIVGSDGEDVDEYTLGTAFDVSTAVFTPPSFDVSVEDTSPVDVAFSSDGTTMFVLGLDGDDVNEYACSTAFDVSTCVFSAGESFVIFGQEAVASGLAFSTDGTKMFIVGTAGVDVDEYTLVTAFDVSTAAFVDSFDLSGEDTFPSGLTFSTDGTKMFVAGDFDTEINQYDLGVGFDVSTAVFFDSFDVTPQDSDPFDVEFSSNGKKMFVLGVGSNLVYEYTLIAAFDLWAPPPSSRGPTGIDGAAPTLGKDRFGVQLVENGFTFNGESVDVGRLYTDFPLISTDVGKLNNIEVKIYENGGRGHIKYVEFALGVPEVGAWYDAEAYIEVWIEQGGDKIKALKIFDDLNIIDSVSAFIGTTSCHSIGYGECLLVSLDYIYRESPNGNVIGVKPADFRGYGNQFFFNDGVEVLGESLNLPAKMTIAVSHADHHEQRGGTLELTQIDRYQNIWEDEYGIQWYVEDGRIKQITLPDYEHPQDKDNIGIQGMKRDHPLFEQYKYEQYLKAIEPMPEYYRTTINYEKAFSEINDILSIEYPESHSGVSDLLIQQEISKAITILEQKCPKCNDQSFAELYNIVRFYNIPVDDANVQEILQQEFHDALAKFNHRYGYIYNYDFNIVESIETTTDDITRCNCIPYG